MEAGRAVSESQGERPLRKEEEVCGGEGAGMARRDIFLASGCEWRS